MPKARSDNPTSEQQKKSQRDRSQAYYERNKVQVRMRKIMNDVTKRGKCVQQKTLDELPWTAEQKQYLKQCMKNREVGYVVRPEQLRTNPDRRRENNAVPTDHKRPTFIS